MRLVMEACRILGEQDGRLKHLLLLSKKGKKTGKNIQQPVFPRGHPP